MVYFSCFDVTSVLHERLSPPGIGFTTSINGEDGPEEVAIVYFEVHFLEMGLQQSLHYITSKWYEQLTVKINFRFGEVGDKENSKFMILVLSMITLVG